MTPQATSQDLETEYAFLAENTSDVIMVLAPDRTLLWVSPSVEQVLGYAATDLVGARAEFVHPEDRERARAGLSAAIADHQTHYRIRLRLLTCEAQVLWVDASMDLWWSAEGAEQRIVASMRDVTEQVATEAALAASERQFRMLAEFTADVVLQLDPQFRICWASPSCEQVVGWPPAELIGRTTDEFIDDMDLPVRKHVQQELVRTTRSHGRVRFRRPDGSLVWLEGNAGTLPDGAGYVLTARSIQDQLDALAESERARAELAASEERFRSAMDNSAIGMCLVSPGGRLLRVNPALCELLGRDEATLTSATWQELTHPDDLDVDLGLVDDVLHGRRDSYRLLKRYLRPDGEAIWGDLSVSCVRHADGSVVNFISQIIDMSERESVMSAVALSEERYRLLADNATDVVVRCSLGGVIEWVSPSVTEVLGWGPADLHGWRLSEFMHPEDLIHVREAQRDILRRGGTEGRTEARFATADGGWRWMSDHGRAILDSDGRVIGGIDALRDVQSEHEAADAIVSSERHYRRLARELETSQQTLRGVIDSLLDPWVHMQAIRDRDGVIVDFEYDDANDAACQANHVTREVLLGQRLLALLPEHESSGLLARYAAVVETGDPLILDDEPWTNPFDGVEGRFDNRAVRVGDGISFTWRDVTERFEIRQRLRSQAEHDLLTGVANRRQLTRRINDLCNRAPRRGMEVAVLYCDLDHFKEVNDSLGHGAGDTVLRAVAKAIRGAVRDQDLVGRMGGDEFVVVLDGVHDDATAMAVADKVCAALHQPIAVAGQTLEPHASVGVAVAKPGEDPDSVLARADVALYEAKRAGRDRVVLAAD